MEATSSPLQPHPSKLAEEGAIETQVALQEVYLSRLQRLLRLRRQHAQDLNQQGVRLLDHSIFAAYCDCRELGAGGRARSVLIAANYEAGPALSGDIEGAA